MPDDFFTIESILTFGGATLAVTVLTVTITGLFNIEPKIVAIVLSLVIAIYGTYETGNGTVGEYFLAVLNGCLIYCSVSGINVIAAGTKKGGTNGKPFGSSTNENKKFGWWPKWY
jgi:hypothetical protein